MRPINGRRERSQGAVAVNGRSAVFKPLRTVPRRTLSTILLRDEPVEERPSPQDLTQLIASLGSRDHAVLLALHQYRYLDREQIGHLYHSSVTRTAQRQMRKLHELGLIQLWHRYKRPGKKNELPAVALLSRRGATVAAAHLKESAAPYLRRADDAYANAWHVDHDLEANGFFVTLAAAATPLSDEGLYHWVGEQACRALYRYEGASLAPDGWGRYVHSGGEVMFLLEWDRATESVARLRAKFKPYARYFDGIADASSHNLLVVTPSTARSEVVLETMNEVFAHSRNRCSAWVSDADALYFSGPLGKVWRGEAGVRCLSDLPALPRIGRRIPEHCIAKPQWWMRRPGGGEGT